MTAGNAARIPSFLACAPPVWERGGPLRNPESWRPTKFVTTRRGLRSSRNPRYVAVSSRFIVDIIATHYERSIRAHANGRLLDLGCGSVPLYETYRGLIHSNVCVDWSSTLHPSVHLDAIVNLNERLPFQDNSFDTVLLTDVLEHVAEPVQLVGEITRILRVGGKTIVGVPFLYWLHEGPHDYYRYTEFVLRRFCGTSGLTVLECAPYGGLPEVLVDLTLKGIGILPAPVSWCLRPMQALASGLSRTSLFTKLSEWTKRSVPLGYILVAQKLTSEAEAATNHRLRNGGRA